MLAGMHTYICSVQIKNEEKSVDLDEGITFGKNLTVYPQIPPFSIKIQISFQEHHIIKASSANTDMPPYVCSSGH